MCSRTARGCGPPRSSSPHSRLCPSAAPVTLALPISAASPSTTRILACREAPGCRCEAGQAQRTAGRWGKVGEGGTAAGEVRVVRVPFEQQGDLHTVVRRSVERGGHRRLRVHGVADQQHVGAGAGDEVDDHRRGEPARPHLARRTGPHHVDGLPPGTCLRVQRAEQRTGDQLTRQRVQCEQRRARRPQGRAGGIGVQRLHSCPPTHRSRREPAYVGGRQRDAEVGRHADCWLRS